MFLEICFVFTNSDKIAKMLKIMRTKIILLLALLISSSLFMLSFSWNKPSIVSPLPLKTYAEAPAPTNSPTPLPTTTPIPAPTNPPTPTTTPLPTPLPIISPSTLNDFFVKYSQEYVVDIELLKKIAKCESGFNSSAINRDYVGLFQFSESLWRNVRAIMRHDPNLDLRLNAEESIKTAAFMIARNQLSVWPNCIK